MSSDLSDSVLPTADIVPASPAQDVEVYTFRISPLIRLTLLLLYVALTIPLPFLAKMTGAPIPAELLWIGIGMGGVILYAALSEQVVLNEAQIQVTYPRWVPQFFRGGWALPWSEIQALKPRSTGQGGLVYYFLTASGAGYLLPMRVAGFAQLVRLVAVKTGIDTQDIRPLAQPWMYVILLVLTVILLLTDSWTIATVLSLGRAS